MSTTFTKMADEVEVAGELLAKAYNSAGNAFADTTLTVVERNTAREYQKMISKAGKALGINIETLNITPSSQGSEFDV